MSPRGADPYGKFLKSFLRGYLCRILRNSHKAHKLPPHVESNVQSCDILMDIQQWSIRMEEWFFLTHKNNIGLEISLPMGCRPMEMLENPFLVVTYVIERVYMPNAVAVGVKVCPGGWSFFTFVNCTLE